MALWCHTDGDVLRFGASSRTYTVVLPPPEKEEAAEPAATATASTTASSSSSGSSSSGSGSATTTKGGWTQSGVRRKRAREDEDQGAEPSEEDLRSMLPSGFGEAGGKKKAVDTAISMEVHSKLRRRGAESERARVRNRCDCCCCCHLCGLTWLCSNDYPHPPCTETPRD